MEKHEMDEHIPEQRELPRLNDVAKKFLADLDEEKKRIPEDLPLCSLVVDEAFDRVASTGRIPGREYYADVFKQKPIKVSQKVFVPVKQYPKFNFTGKILGPKGNSLRRLQEETQCRIVIKGRGSMRDRVKEEEMRNSGDPRHSHLNKDLHLEISTIAIPAEAYARVAYALAEIRKYLVPDKNDEVSHEQLRELMEIDPQSVKRSTHSNMPQMNRSVLDRKIGDRAVGVQKYQNLIKHATMLEPDEDEEEVVHRTYEKRVLRPGYEYVEAGMKSTPSAYKRQQPTPYGSEIKRLRESAVKTYAKSPISILKKYKQ